MPLSDHYRGGATERLLVSIITVDPPNRRVEVVGKDASVIQIGVGRVSGLFVWPVQGEYWTIIRENGEWALEDRLENPDNKQISSLNPGEGVVQANTVWTPNGEHLVRSSELEAVAALTHTGELWTSALKYTAGPPAGSLLCNGASLPPGNPTTAALRAALLADGSPHGVSGADPKVPDMNDRVPVGKSGTKVVGASGGVENVTLTDAQSGRPAGTTGGQSADHSHSASQDLLYNIPGGGAVLYAPGGAELVHGGINTNGSSNDHNHTMPAAGGAANPHTNMPPYVVVTYLIRL